MSPESGDGIRPPSPESGQPDSGDQSDRNPAIWPVSGHLIGSGQTGRFPAIWPDLARKAGIRPSGRIWPESRFPAGPGQGGRIPAGPGQGGRFQAGSGQGGRIPAGPGQGGRFPAVWPDGSGQIRPLWPDPARWPETGILCRNPAKLPESGHFRRNPVIPDSDETVRIPAFISNSSYVSQNQVKIVRI